MQDAPTRLSLRALGWLVLAHGVCLLPSCGLTPSYRNKPLASYDSEAGYRFDNLAKGEQNTDSLFVVLSGLKPIHFFPLLTSVMDRSDVTAAYYVVDINLQQLVDAEERDELRSLPTNFALKSAQVDALIEAGGDLLANEPDFQRLVRDLGQASSEAGR